MNGNYLQFCSQIADFGMSRDLTNEYYLSQGGRIPLKWTAPEALLYHKYSTGSDVWSYGMVLFEIWSLGHKPFEEETAEQVGGAYLTGGRGLLNRWEGLAEQVGGAY